MIGARVWSLESGVLQVQVYWVIGSVLSPCCQPQQVCDTDDKAILSFDTAFLKPRVKALAHALPGTGSTYSSQPGLNGGNDK